jgi:Spy/CpxP family protein refolding chaperone
MIRTRSILTACAVLCLASTTAAQQAAQAPAHVRDPLAGSFFPPELIMQNQQVLRLTEEQRSAMIAEIQRVQEQAQPIQWQLTQMVERFATMLREPRVDEGAALTILDSVLQLEREMKRLQIGLLVRLKNRLTEQQQALLRERLSTQQQGARPF